MEKVSSFLDSNSLCVFTVLLPDGSPHSAVVAFSHKDDPLRLYVSTSKESVKASGLNNGETQRASVVVGWSEQDFITLQIRGSATKVKSSEIEGAKEIHYSKHPSSLKYAKDANNMFIRFDVEWFRYSNLKAKPVEIISSAS